MSVSKLVVHAVADRRTDGAVSDLNPPNRVSTKPALSAAEVGAMNPWSCKNRPPACNRRQEHSEVSRPHENRPQRTGSVSMFEFGLLLGIWEGESAEHFFYCVTILTHV